MAGHGRGRARRRRRTWATSRSGRSVRETGSGPSRATRAIYFVRRRRPPVIAMIRRKLGPRPRATERLWSPRLPQRGSGRLGSRSPAAASAISFIVVDVDIEIDVDQDGPVRYGSTLDRGAHHRYQPQL
ncbi:hypothetical protein Franean1_2698 [Parafrankia sp. EAN1pec]|nr:hypothetical protein Franean1_2698 [Frankia sp. EAN1pec]